VIGDTSGFSISVPSRVGRLPWRVGAVIEGRAKGSARPGVAESLPGLQAFVWVEDLDAVPIDGRKRLQGRGRRGLRAEARACPHVLRRRPSRGSYRPMRLRLGLQAVPETALGQLRAPTRNPEAPHCLTRWMTTRKETPRPVVTPLRRASSAGRALIAIVQADDDGCTGSLGMPVSPGYPGSHRPAGWTTTPREQAR
jgi:hypothetical protein